MKAYSEDHLDVLFVSDDADLAEVYRMKLELDGYLVRIVRRDDDWPQASWHPDIVYLDVQDGDPAGIRGEQRLRAHPALRDLPAVLLSTLRSHQLRERGFQLGPMDYVVTVSLPAQLSQAASTLPRVPVGTPAG
jgi:DNA-binding response OmpR family regulator